MILKLSNRLLSKILRLWSLVTFKSSKRYWIERYKAGGNSGHGSYKQLAELKANFLNKFVEENGIQTLIEFGCGDGNQLKLAKYPHYIGYDVSPDAIDICKEQFNNDPHKSFFMMDDYRGEKAELALSLDVLYHLVEENVFDTYMHLLFNAAESFVIIYSTNTDKKFVTGPHIKHRHFTDWIDKNIDGWKFFKHVPEMSRRDINVKAHPHADFYIYQKLRKRE